MSEPITLSGPEQVDRLRLHAPAVFLSASIPSQRDLRGGRPYAHEVRQRRVKSAVTWLCRSLFEARVQVVFGGHPAITPLLLAVAREFEHNPADPPAVFIFQSNWFEPVIPKETYELADWSRGQLVWTEEGADRQSSLTLMRRCMVSASGLNAGIFVGGMEGILEEAELFREHVRGPGYALASTGGATEVLYQTEPSRWRGHLDASLVTSSLSYPDVARRIVDDLLPRELAQ